MGQHDGQRYEQSRFGSAKLKLTVAVVTVAVSSTRSTYLCTSSRTFVPHLYSSQCYRFNQTIRDSQRRVLTAPWVCLNIPIRYSLCIAYRTPTARPCRSAWTMTRPARWATRSLKGSAEIHTSSSNNSSSSNSSNSLHRSTCRRRLPANVAYRRRSSLPISPRISRTCRCSRRRRP